jgi:hypothetical protein
MCLLKAPEETVSLETMTDGIPPMYVEVGEKSPMGFKYSKGTIWTT